MSITEVVAWVDNPEHVFGILFMVTWLGAAVAGVLLGYQSKLRAVIVFLRVLGSVLGVLVVLSGIGLALIRTVDTPPAIHPFLWVCFVGLPIFMVVVVRSTMYVSTR